MSSRKQVLWLRLQCIIATLSLGMLVMAISGCSGRDGSQGAIGLQGLPGEEGTTGEQGLPGEQGPPGPIDTTVPSTPTNLRVFSNPSGPPTFDLRWSLPESPVAIQFFVIYESDQTISASSEELVVATVPGAARTAPIRLASNSGKRHFRISAVSFTGVEGLLSSEYIIDTTARLLFRADKTTDNVTDLYSATPGSGAEPINLSNLGAASNVDESFPSPDGRRVAFTADKDMDNIFELYVVPTDGSSAAVKVSGSLVANGQVATNFSSVPMIWSPDGSRIAFIADKHTDDVVEVYVALADGSGVPVKVSGTLVAGGSVEVNIPQAFDWSSDGTQIAFVADKRANGVNELFVAPADGSAEPVLVSGTIVTGGNVSQFLWAPDGTRLAFSGDILTDNVEELFVASANENEVPTIVSGTQTPTASINDFDWSPDSTRLAILSDRLTDDVFELFVNSAAGGGEPIPLSANFSAFADVNLFAWSPNSQYIAFSADKTTDGVVELYVSPATGGTDAHRVSPGSTSIPQFAWSPNSERLAAITGFGTTFRLFTGTTQFLDQGVSGTMVANGGVIALAWSPDGNRLAMVADKTTDEIFELYGLFPASNEQPVAVSGTMGANADVNSDGLVWTPLGNP
ncbi:PD40 domain-containing protein [Candidatus Manganitrophus noduliformans]|nr:PD40 domain-containing protein [Candidatus Manganitrophus noduliformans]